MGLSTFDEDEYVAAALRAGVSGFPLEVAPPEDLVAAVRTVAARQDLLAPAVTLRVVESFAAARAGPGPGRGAGPLTERETDVLALFAAGLSHAGIAGRPYLGEATVTTYVSRCLLELALRDRVLAVAIAYESGLVTLGR